MEKGVENKTIRNSSIEFLKIISLVLIVLSHAVPFYGDKNLISYINLNLATNDISRFILIVFRNLGYIGNIIFVMCSAYFLINKKQVKIKKVFYIVFDCLTISLIYLCINLFINDISIKDVMKQFFPITFQTNWFICCYLLLYIMHPFLNKIILSSKKETLLRINIFFIVLYVLIAWILGGERYYYNNLVGFIIIYFMVAYNKLYLSNLTRNSKVNRRLLLFGIFGFIAVLIITNVLGQKIDFLNNKMLHFASMVNPFGIMIGLSLLNFFSNKYFENKVINYISSLSLLFYIIHENVLFRNYNRPLFYQSVFPEGNVLVWVLIEAVLLWIYGIVLSIIYKQVVQKILYQVIDKIYGVAYNIWNRIEKVLIKIN